jgi:L-lactate utilization protein LutC
MIHLISSIEKDTWPDIEPIEVAKQWLYRENFDSEEASRIRGELIHTNKFNYDHACKEATAHIRAESVAQSEQDLKDWMAEDRAADEQYQTHLDSLMEAQICIEQGDYKGAKLACPELNDVDPHKLSGWVNHLIKQHTS